MLCLDGDLGLECAVIGGNRSAFKHAIGCDDRDLGGFGLF
jgi:hypothetical protein